MIMSLKSFRLGLLLLATLLPTAAAHAAATLAVSPVRVMLSKGQPVAVVHIHNQGAEPAVVQMSVQAWRQEDGEDRFSDASTILSCPPIATLAPGQDQVVRIGLVERPTDWTVEGAFRLFVQEVPPAPSENGRQVQLTIRISIPVFLAPATASQPAFDWQVEHRGADGLWLTATNGGTLHALVTGVRLHDGKALVFEAAQHKYVLPGATMAWRLDETAPFDGTLPASVALSVTTDQGVYQEDLPVAK